MKLIPNEPNDEKMKIEKESIKKNDTKHESTWLTFKTRDLNHETWITL